MPTLPVDHQSYGRRISQVSDRVADNVPEVTTADGSDPATTQALANALKASHNALLASLVAAGLMAAEE